MKVIKVSKTFFVPKSNYEQVALGLYNLLVENFSDTFFVGGMIRNLFWNKKISDVDIATTARPEQISKLLIKHGWKHNSLMVGFGVITIPHQNQKIEITTFRKEVYTKGRYPKVSFTKSLKIDSQRRDFTINSLYFQAKNQQVIDPQSGYKDLQTKSLRCVGDAGVKFTEDPLRIVRAIRFQKQYQLKLETQTALALQNNMLLIKTLTKSRIKTEIAKVNSQTIKNSLTKKFL